MTAQWTRLFIIAAMIGSLANFNSGLAEADAVRVRLETTDPEGNSISAIGLGGDFLVRTFVEDLRDDSAAGVFAGYLDLIYPNDLVSIAGAIEYASTYKNGRTGNVSLAGLVDEVGAFGGFSPLGSGEHLLFTLPFTANALGSAVFASDPADAIHADVLVHGLNTAVPPELIDFGSASLSIVPADCLDDGTFSLDCACAVGNENAWETFEILQGDLDGDGIVGFGDFLVLSENFGQPQASYSAGDLDCSGTVDFADFLVMSENFGKTVGNAAAVPEPLGTLMFCLGLLGIAATRQRRR